MWVSLLSNGDKQMEMPFTIQAANNSVLFSLQVPPEFSGQTNIHLSKNFFLTNKAREKSNTFINLREVLNRFKLPAGEYIIVPSTFEPDKNGDFCLRVFSEKNANSTVIDDEIEGNFDEDAEISAFELRSILNKILAKRECFLHQQFQMPPAGQDIKSDGFSIETCKIMVDLLDKIYREIDVDRSGTMNSYEMRRALETAGFKLNCQLHQVIVARFADEDLVIDFDNFVRCLIRLETLFSECTLSNQAGSAALGFQQENCPRSPGYGAQTNSNLRC
ncbi:hypothetical protein EK904_013483 [Melospiza melodia maxima]|nr:hypothetical protein EK904_013483 [Melospiza melodia maxima]